MIILLLLVVIMMIRIHLFLEIMITAFHVIVAFEYVLNKKAITPSMLLIEDSKLKFLQNLVTT